MTAEARKPETKATTVMLSRETYRRLDNIRQKRESFNDAVGRLCEMWEKRRRETP